MWNASFGLTISVVLCLTNVCLAQEKQTRDEMVLQDRQRMLKNDAWIYDDFQAAGLVAEKEGKPLMVVLRCIP